ncbi:hypothetical protein [Pseudoalteromonas marina]|uniref:hypothetical protein n=1 Tax=Pseudoalteromonas marina TaxID=267375 RepID=UPI002737275D|nr:hypothetical protein [Pseudoalteromonas marina]MDP2487490.1 hypothetical protein [Pseudoalteromonas marina]
MDIKQINQQISLLHDKKLKYGALNVDTSVKLPNVISSKTKLPLFCSKCNAQCAEHSQWRSLDNLRAIKKGAQGTGCVICKTISETEQACNEFLLESSIFMRFIVKSFDVKTLKVQLFDKQSEFYFGKPIGHEEIRNISYGNRELCYSNNLKIVRSEVVPLVSKFMAKFPQATTSYLGYYKVTASSTNLHYFDVSFPANCLIRDPNGLNLKEIPASKLRHILKQQEKDEHKLEVFIRECKDHGAIFLKCLGRQGNLDPNLARGSELYFEYETNTGDIKRNTLPKARECNFQQTARIGERIILAIMRGLYPDVDWLANSRPGWNTAPMYGNEKTQVRLEIDIISNDLMVAVERQSKWHTDVVDEKRNPNQVDRYAFYDPIKKQNAIDAGYTFIEIERPEVDENILLAEIEEKLGLTASTEQRRRIKKEVILVKQYAYRQYRHEFLQVLIDNGSKLVSPTKDDLLSPIDEVTIQMTCGHFNINTMGYFKQRNGLKGCRECITKDNIARQQSERENDIKERLGNIWNKLEKSVQKQIVDTTLKGKIACPHCRIKVTIGHSIAELSDFLIKNKGFYCIHCHNSGLPITQDPYLAGTVYQWKTKIKTVIAKTQWGDSEKWYTYTSVLEKEDFKTNAQGRIVVSLTCPKGHFQSKTLSEWRMTFNSVKRMDKGQYCEECYAMPLGNTYDENDHLTRMHVFHPNASSHKISSSKGLIPFQCNEVTTIGRFTISHPVYYESLNALSQKVKQKDPETYAYCLCCAVTKNKTTPGGKKHIEQLLSRFKLRAAFIADKQEAASINSICIKKQEGLGTTGEIASSDKIIAQCHNAEHPQIVTTPNNLFSPHKKGYCTLCLKDLGVKTFSDLSNKY